MRPPASRHDFTTGGHLSGIARLTLPGVLSGILYQFYGLCDMFWLQDLKPAAEAAAAQRGVGCCLPLLIMHFSFTALVSVGAATLIAQHTGARRERDVAATAAQVLTLGVVVAAITGLGFALSLDFVLDEMNIDPEARRYARQYLLTIVAGSPAMYLLPLLEAIFRGRGYPRIPLLLQAVTVGTHFFLGPLLITGEVPVLVFSADGFLGLAPGRWALNPHPLGAGGAALATIAARCVGDALGLVLLFRGAAGFVPRGFLPVRAATLRRCLAIGLPQAANIFFFAIIVSVVFGMANDFGPREKVTGYVLGQRGVEAIIYAICSGFQAAAVTLVGQNMGAGQPRRAEVLAWKTVAICAAVQAGVAVLLLLSPETVVGVFSKDPVAVAHAGTYLRIVAVSEIFLGVETALMGAFQGAGNTLPVLLILTFGDFLRIPGSWLLGRVMGLGIEGIWYTVAGSVIFNGVVLSAWFLTGRWKRAGPAARPVDILALELTDAPAPPPV
ncbi:MAG: MATE family efflux transporter [Planctomycetes bacterium]|nr:MATE family efflux transporter [Planctomycetota bacterium]